MGKFGFLIGILLFAAGFARADDVSTGGPALPAAVNLPLPIGTIEKINHIQQNNLGTWQMQVTFQNGPQKDQSTTLHEFPGMPSVKFYTSKSDLEHDQPTEDPKQAKYAKTTRVLDPAKDAAVFTGEPTQQMVNAIDQGNQAVQKVRSMGDDNCDLCELANVYHRDVEDLPKMFNATTAADDAALKEPQDGELTSPDRPVMCGSRTGNYDVCIYEGDTTPGQFQFINGGEKLVSGKDTYEVGREWTFNFEGQKRQDLGFMVQDSADGSEARSHEAFMMVFPRKYLPSIRIDGQKQIVTLPTGETVTYDAKTKKILSGAMSEKPVGAGAVGVAYTGSGVMVRVDGKADDPRIGKGTATISKDGKSCKVPLKSLWPDQSESSALHFKFSSDADFDQFLRTKTHCGFGI